MTLRLSTVLVALLSAGIVAQSPQPANLDTLLRNLGSLDYPVRMNAARQIRRLPEGEAVTALVQAARNHTDEYVRFRALVLLTAFADRRTGEVVRDLLRDRNDRVRAVAYAWLERHPDRALTSTLLALLQTEQAEFVRPALIGALAALGSDSQVQRALVTEVARGLDFFRSAVIETLGRHRAAYAFDALAAMTKIEGPLQDDAVLAIGRIGDPRGRAVIAQMTTAPPPVTLTIRAAECLLGSGCEVHMKALTDAASATGALPAVTRAAVEAITALAMAGQSGALAALVGLPARADALRDDAAIGFAVAAVMRPEVVIAWLGTTLEPARGAAIDLLKEGFDHLEEDFGEEQFFAAARASYWKAPEGSPSRDLSAALIQKLEF